MNKKRNIVGSIYFFIHFILETTTFYILSSFTNNPMFWTIAVMYDLFAFVPQALFGALSDKYRKLNLGLIGTILTTLALISLYLKLPLILIFVLLTLGNCIVHVHGAESTLRVSEGKMFPSALFVSGGAFGIITGKLLYKHKISTLLIIGINIISIILILLSKMFKKYEKDKLEEYNYSNKKYSIVTIVLLATLVVAVRSYMSYGIPTGWNKTELQAILLFSFMGLGKALGGLLIDKVNIKFTSLISTLLALPFLLFGENNMYLSLIGVMLFSMTMPITLALILSRMKESPGIAFGFTTIGLFVGAFPAYIITISSQMVNFVIFTFLTILCTIILYKIEE